jgi:putative Holliday junction resolvase
MIFTNINLSTKTECENTFFKLIYLLCLKNVFLQKQLKMARVLAIDFGKKRTGIAVTDELQIIASGLTTVNTADLLSFLKEYTSKEKVELFIVGQPKQMDNSDSESEALMLPFVKKIEKLFPQIPVKRIDERFTSKMAFQTMIDSGMKKKQRRNKAMVDEISATIILQSFLYSQH